MRVSLSITIPLLLAAGVALGDGAGTIGTETVGADSVGVATVAGVMPTPAAANITVAPAPLPTNVSASVPIADEVVVRKSQRRLYLMRHGEVLRSYRVALGLQPDGPKERAGDFRTPEGRYLLTRRNSHSDYFLSIQVSYPNAEDLRRAHRDHVNPGGSIMVHGLPNNQRHAPDYYAAADWTDGCIAMSNADMVELWLMVQDNTPIEILP
ncbi:MAG TPA: L,D-transpeptidase family protein [Steroidobacteraceae bacterium]|jgi:lipoprotein-anchoring transpeptidase ErfK/SrfK